MERFLSTIFPCCFPNRHAHRSDATERTPLLNDNAGSSRNSINESSISTPGSERRKRHSVLPSPAYDANVLRGIVDEFKGKLIAVEPSTGLADHLLSGIGSETGAQKDEATDGEKKYLTPIHTLRSSSDPDTTHTRLVDIWSDPLPPPPPQPMSSSTMLSYSAAARRGQSAAAGAGKKGKRTSAKPTTGNDKEDVEQRTYQTLAETARSKPVVFDWVLDDGEGA